MLSAIVVMAACGAKTAAPPDPPAETVNEVTIGVANEDLAAILEDHWAQRLRDRPIFATRIGVHDYDDRIRDNSPAAIKKSRAQRDALITRLETLLQGELSASDLVTAQLLHARLLGDRARQKCRFDEWTVSARSNPLEAFSDLPRRPRTQAEAHGLRKRYEAIPAYVDHKIAALRGGAAEGLVADAESLQRTLDMLDAQLGGPASASPFMDVHPGDGVEIDVEDVVRDAVLPAIRRYRDFVREELLPHGRPPDKTGLAALPVRDCYSGLVQHHTSLPLSPQEVHDTGVAEIERIDAELASLGAKALGTASLAETLARLRGDRALYFATEDEVEEAARTSLAKAKAAMPEFFGRLPKADCRVEVVPAFKAPFTTIGYYEPPHADGSKPGEYLINVYQPQTRPRFEARVLAVHEAIPGHHLQIAIAQELEDVPLFRRHTGYTAYVEGWALYTERLAEEMGLYETDLDRFGMLSFDAWRAARLVVDTGIHAMGWSRKDAEQYMLDHTALTPENISNEVDRYIGWPGQALGYKIGQLTIWRLRREAEAALGEAFDLEAFHDVVLGGGPVTLPILTDRVHAYVASAKR